MSNVFHFNYLQYYNQTDLATISDICNRNDIKRNHLIDIMSEDYQFITIVDNERTEIFEKHLTIDQINDMKQRIADEETRRKKDEEAARKREKKNNAKLKKISKLTLREHFINYRRDKFNIVKVK